MTLPHVILSCHAAFLFTFLYYTFLWFSYFFFASLLFLFPFLFFTIFHFSPLFFSSVARWCESSRHPCRQERTCRLLQGFLRKKMLSHCVRATQCWDTRMRLVRCGKLWREIKMFVTWIISSLLSHINILSSTQKQYPYFTASLTVSLFLSLLPFSTLSVPPSELRTVTLPVT